MPKSSAIDPYLGYYEACELPLELGETRRGLKILRAKRGEEGGRGGEVAVLKRARLILSALVNTRRRHGKGIRAQQHTRALAHTLLLPWTHGKEGMPSETDRSPL